MIVSSSSTTTLLGGLLAAGVPLLVLCQRTPLPGKGLLALQFTGSAGAVTASKFSLKPPGVGLLPGTMLVASVENTMVWPSAEAEGAKLGPSAGSSFGPREIRMTASVFRSLTKISWVLPLPSLPLSRFVAC